MEKRLLFINHSQEEINEFRMAMPRGTFIIDIADNGIDAGILMKQHHYGVIILDMYLKGYGGEQIIKYLNESHPDTICIIYTYNLTRGQLTFLLNHRNIFRIFLSPVNILEEVYPAIHEAFAVYDLHLAEREEEERVERLVSEKERSIGEKTRILEKQQKRRRLLKIFLDKMLEETMKLSGNREEKKELLTFEKEILKKAGSVLEYPIHNLKEMQEQLYGEFKNRYQECCIKMLGEEEESELGYYYHTLYVVLWMLLQQYQNGNGKNGVEIRAGIGEDGTLKAEMCIRFLEAGEESKKDKRERQEEERQIIEYAAKEILESCVKEIKKDEVRYYLKVKSLEKAIEEKACR